PWVPLGLVEGAFHHVASAAVQCSTDGRERRDYVPERLTRPDRPKGSSTELAECTAYLIRTLDGDSSLLQRARDGAARRRQLRGSAPVEPPRPRRAGRIRMREERTAPLQVPRDRLGQRR